MEPEKLAMQLLLELAKAGKAKALAMLGCSEAAGGLLRQSDRSWL